MSKRRGNFIQLRISINVILSTEMSRQQIRYKSKEGCTIVFTENVIWNLNTYEDYCCHHFDIFISKNRLSVCSVIETLQLVCHSYLPPPFLHECWTVCFLSLKCSINFCRCYMEDGKCFQTASVSYLFYHFLLLNF